MIETIFNMSKLIIKFLVIIWEWLSNPLITQDSTLIIWIYEHLPTEIADIISPFFTMTPFEFIISAFTLIILLKVLALIWNALPVL